MFRSGRVERRISRRACVRAEGVPRHPAERADHRPWHEQHQPHPAARAWARRAERPTSAGRWTCRRLRPASGPPGWSTPSVYSNGDTMQAMAAEGIAYTLDQMDFDIISRLRTPAGALVAAALSGGHGRHGPAAGTDEDAHGELQDTSGWITCWSWPARPAPTPRGEATTVVIGIAIPFFAHRHARRGGRTAACSLAPQDR